jgi:flavin-dependent dehydrogenase
VGVRAYFDGVTGMHPGNYPELHFLRGVLPGYLWIFPLPNGRANIGLGIPSDVVRKKRLNIREILADAVKNEPTIKDRFTNATQLGKLQGWGLPMSADPLPVSGDGFVLTGDAASLIDPFSGEGIGNALYSGMLAAGAIIKANEANDFSAAFLKQHYDNELYRHILGELRTSAALQRLCRYPWLFNFVVNKARKSHSLQQTISGMFANLDLRDQLRRPSFYLKILMNK